MNYFRVSIVPLFLLLSIATALPAAASAVHPDDFESWAIKKGVEIDGRWIRTATREAGATVTSAPDGTMTVTRRSAVMKAGRTAKMTGKTYRAAAGNSTGIDGSSFTKRGSQKFLWKSTRDRNGPSRGTSKLNSPAQAMRASAFKRRLPSNVSSKYRRSTGYGRAGAWRRSPKMGTRTTTSGTRRRSAASSLTRGATRVRRSATRRR